MTSIASQKLLQHRLSHGGILRNVRRGRRERPLSTKHPIHLVFKADRQLIPGGFRTHRRFQLIHQLVQKYALKFYVKVEQISIQGNHWHLIVRTSRRSGFQNFLRVVAGQTAQRFLVEGLVRIPSVTDTPVKRRRLWAQRPFTRVVKGYRAYRTVQDYVQLNELEARGKIPYRKARLNGLRKEEREKLWRGAIASIREMKARLQGVTDTPAGTFAARFRGVRAKRRGVQLTE